MRHFGAIRFGIGLALIGLMLLWFTVQSVDASTTLQKTLNNGQTLIILSNGCNLKVISSSDSEVKVRCIVPALQPGASDIGTANSVTLNPGKKLTVTANACTLNILKKSKSKIKINCGLPTVIVAPGGTLSFSKASITIHQGQTVQWFWQGGPHTVTSTSDSGVSADGTFCSPNDLNCDTVNTSNAGAKYTHTFNSTGTFVYYCHFHGYAIMHAQVVVEP